MWWNLEGEAYEHVFKEIAEFQAKHNFQVRDQSDFDALVKIVKEKLMIELFP